MRRYYSDDNNQGTENLKLLTETAAWVNQYKQFLLNGLCADPKEHAL